MQDTDVRLAAIERRLDQLTTLVRDALEEMKAARRKKYTVRRAGSSWKERVPALVAGKEHVMLADLVEWLGVPPADIKQIHLKQAGSILRDLGWERRKWRVGISPRPVWAYYPPSRLT